MTDAALEAPSRAGSLALVGGLLALDFCNTASGRGSPTHQDHLRTAGDLLEWAFHANILDGAGKNRLDRACHDDAALSRRLLRRARALRDAVYEVTTALTHQQAARPANLDTIAETYAACLAKGHLGSRDGAFGWTWSLEETPEEAILGPIAASAMAMITDADRGRLKQCEGHQCGWLFLDTTKSNNRRWCEMEPCGNRAKQKRRRGRLRSEA